MSGSHFEFYEDESDTTQSHRWRLVAGNYEIVASSEGYASRANAERGAAQMTRNAAEALANLLEEKAASQHRREIIGEMAREAQANGEYEV